MMGLHKLTAGDGYMYLIRQVAAGDATDRGRPSLADYYSSKGETPGRWLGSGLTSLGAPAGRDPTDPTIAEIWSIAPGSEVREDQMKALFGEGLHPNADQIARHVTTHGGGQAGALHAARLGRPFRVNNNENAFTRRLRDAYGDHNTALGERRDAPLDDDIRARLRTAIGTQMFTETHTRAPANDRELTGYIARQSRAQTTAVAGYDLTFTPVKSVSALWALAPRSMARTIEDCHHKAVADALAFLERHAAFSRMGADGVAQVDTTGLIAAAFDHRDSRAGDPNLHTHVAISNKVYALGADGIGRWLALDGTPLHKAAVAASELYNTRLEAHLIADVGVIFHADRTLKPGKRPVREISGVPTELLERWSARRTAIEHRVGHLAKTFQTEHGREPTAVEMLALSQQATLETRQGKHEPRSLAEQRHTWRAEAIELLGSQRHLSRLIADITSHPGARRAPAVTATWVDQQAATVITRVSHARATWQINHVRAETQRLLRHSDRDGGGDVAERIVTAALTTHSTALTSHADTDMGEPAPLRRRDDASVYTAHDTTVYTSTDILAAERRILAAAATHGGRVADAHSVELALLEAHAQHGTELNDGQRHLVRMMATSGARVQLALAPAGTGKTTAMAALAAAWRNSGGTVIGLAPTAGAAEVLGRDLGAATDTIAKLVQLTRPGGGPAAPYDDPARTWFDTITGDTLLIVDEAGMAATADLDTVIGHAMAAGASVRLIGDDQQLTSISAGGVLRDIAARHDALTLSTVVRFTSEVGDAEGAASLALRDGDPAGIAFYLDHDRVHIGADHVAADTAYQAWAHDRAHGRHALLLAPTNDLVAQLNERARLDRLRASNDKHTSTVTVTLGDGLTASAGDWITTRSNARWLRLTGGAWVKNGHRWLITEARQDGSLLVTPLLGGATTRAVRLPAHYVAAHTTLGYASTINSAQGVTADTCHVVGSDRLTRQQLYVALTRGKLANHLYFSTAEADPHRVLTPKATHPPTAVDILTAVLRRDGAQVSAHTAAATEADPFARLHAAAAMYTDALTAAAEHLAGAATMARIDDAAREISITLTDQPAWPVLRRHLALLAIDGHDPLDALLRAAATPLGNTIDPAAVLDWRLTAPSGADERVGPLRWLATIPEAVSAQPQWGIYLTKRHELVTTLAQQIRDHARHWTAATAPVWARPLIANQPQLMAEIAVFRAAHNVDPADTRITGPEQHPNRSAAVQHLMLSRVDAALRRGEPRTQRWRPTAQAINPHIPNDPYWPRLAAHLDQAARAGADIAQLLTDAITRHGLLPDELPAAALWWRLSGTLAPPTLDLAETRLRPPWTPDLHHVLGSRIAEVITADPAWPSLVAAVAAAGWPPRDLLAAAAEHLRDIAEHEGLRPDEYARLLTYRVELLTHHAAGIDTDIPHPADRESSFSASDSEFDLQATEPHLDEPPPDPDSYTYGYADDALGDLDFTDLASHRPVDTSADRDADITALHAERDAAHRCATELADAVHDHRGPAETAAAAEIIELQRRYDAQHAHHVRVAAAHDAWVAAEHRAEIHRSVLDRLQAHIAASAQPDPVAAAHYRAHYAELATRTAGIDAAVTQATEQLTAARAALLEVAGDPNAIVTARDIDARQAELRMQDLNDLNDARVHARDLDSRLARAEAAIARAFAQTDAPSAQYTDSVLDLDAARAEVDLLEAAAGRSPAAMYRVPDDVLAPLDAPAQTAVIAVANSVRTVQVLTSHPDADKSAALTALTAAAHRDGKKVLALTNPERDDPAERHYADTAAAAATAIDLLHLGRWQLPLGSLVIVDDADHLAPGRLRWLAEHAATSNTKLLLLTNRDPGCAPAHTAAQVLSTHLPWAQSLGTLDPTVGTPATALERAATSPTRFTDPGVKHQIDDLLGRRDRLIGDYSAESRRVDMPREPGHGLDL